MKTITIPNNVIRPMFQRAWDILWAKQLAGRKKHGDWRGRSYHLSATDLEHGVRGMVEWASRGNTEEPTIQNYEEWCHMYYSRIRISVEGYRGGLSAVAFRWLLTMEEEGVLEGHNFGRGHCSGRRYRPAGTPLAPAEKRTMEKKAQEDQRDYKADPLPVHARLGSYGSRPICQYKPGHYSWRRGTSRTSAVREEVTCATCINLIDGKPLTGKEEGQLATYHRMRETGDFKHAEHWGDFMRLAKRKNASKFGKPDQD